VDVFWKTTTSRSEKAAWVRREGGREGRGEGGREVKVMIVPG